MGNVQISATADLLVAVWLGSRRPARTCDEHLVPHTHRRRRSRSRRRRRRGGWLGAAHAAARGRRIGGARLGRHLFRSSADCRSVRKISGGAEGVAQPLEKLASYMIGARRRALLTTRPNGFTFHAIVIRTS